MIAKTPKEIGRRSGKIFLNSIPDNIAVRDQQTQEDYGIDYEFEVITPEDKPTGIIFKVQQKGTESVNIIDNERHISYRELPIEKAKYYLNLDIPAIFVIVDVDVDTEKKLEKEIEQAEQEQGKIIESIAKLEKKFKFEITKIDFYHYLKNPVLKPLEHDRGLKNLAMGYWVYDELLHTLHNNGWVRFAAGFKAGIYGHSNHKWCLKIIGMGIGDDPSYFCERGYYLEHEKNMLLDFKKAGFDFQPNVMTQEQSIEFLIHECHLSEQQAKWRIYNNDVIIIEYLPGIPLATQTGHYVNYEINPFILNAEILKKIGRAIDLLRIKVNEANTNGLLHNDPMPSNIIFILADNDEVIAKLVDFELAQNKNEIIPQYVIDSVNELEDERDVPRNQATRKPLKNLDQHLLDEVIRLVENLSEKVNKFEHTLSSYTSIFVTIPFMSGMNINLNNAMQYWTTIKAS